MSIDVTAVLSKLNDAQLAKIVALCDENADAIQVAKELASQGIDVARKEAEALLAALRADKEIALKRLADAKLENVAGGRETPWGGVGPDERECAY